ncbi:hypothetical protein [Nocardiopsis rhodophaea]|uniref:hypothetical protein n=1 Tax=Nocardiopsis rhodophaea TaxID=280238 RepID=UPI0031DF9F3E
MSLTPGLPINEAAATAKTDLLSMMATWMMATWAGMMIDEFGLRGPNRRDVTRLTAFLRSHLDLILSHPAAGYFVEEILSAAETARRVARGGGSREIPLGACVHDGCASPVVARVSQDRSPARIMCEVGHTWSAQEWLLLTHELRNGSGEVRWPTTRGNRTEAAPREQEPVYRTLPTDLAALAAGVSPATIRKWASRGKLTRLGTRSRAEYHVCEVMRIAADGAAPRHHVGPCSCVSHGSGPTRTQRP